jgi:hypothetical protein
VPELPEDAVRRRGRQLELAPQFLDLREIRRSQQLSSCLRVRSICSKYAGRNRRSICRCRRSVMSITFACSIFGRARLLAIAARSAALLARRLAWSSSRRPRIASRSRSSPVVPFPARRS